MLTNLFLGSSLGVLVSSFFICIFAINLIKLNPNKLKVLSQKKLFSSPAISIIFIFFINIFFMIIGLILSIIYVVFFDTIKTDLILSSNINFSYFIIGLNLLLLLPIIIFVKTYRISATIFSLIFIIVFGWILPYFIT
ncbi:MAG: hypothetical protein CL758_05295 [Chloroflexi bacterium]|nr:hypothetical protein [Chloroflexota bacterium]